MADFIGFFIGELAALTIARNSSRDGDPIIFHVPNTINPQPLIAHTEPQKKALLANAIGDSRKVFVPVSAFSQFFISSSLECSNPIEKPLRAAIPLSPVTKTAAEI